MPSSDLLIAHGARLSNLMLEIIVVDGGSADGTVALATAIADSVVIADKGRARQMNAGASHANGEWLLFLHADTLPSEGLVGALKRWKSSGRRWGFHKLRLSSRRPVFRLLETMINLRSCISRIGTGDQALFCRADFFEEQGGFADIPLMEDVEFCKRARMVERPYFENCSPVVTSSRRWEENGILKTVWLMWRLRWAFFRGVAPERLAGLYRSARPDDREQCSPEASRLKRDRLVIQFAKSPIPGTVKTRLFPALGEAAATALHQLLVRSTLDALCSGDTLFDIQLWGTAGGDDFYRALVRGRNVKLHQQTGVNLGQRMHAALVTGLRHYRHVLLVGSDCPFIDSAYLSGAFDQLAAGHDVVIGPATDGGYVLIGASKVTPQLFDGVDWGTSSVMQQTRAQLSGLGWRWVELSALSDIDHPEDLKRLESLPDFEEFIKSNQ
ncbi:MAG: TIGR04283 family arsenosugar biosynthesis glycosyltransferase [bacterium]